MIISASYRTDIPAYYGRWFQARLQAGFTHVRNPYGGKPANVDLSPDAVDGFVFWTRNPAPFAEALQSVAALGAPFVMQMTITGYPRALEAGVLDTATAIAAFRTLSERWGARAMVWRYDPVLVSEITPPDWHLANFARLAEALAGATDEVVLSHAHMYRKTTRNLGKAAAAFGFSWSEPLLAEKRALLAALADIAAAYGFRPTLCAQPDVLAAGPETQLAPAKCIDAARLGDIAGKPLAVRTRGQRPGCMCAESRDIGRYDSCAQGCAYCYANASRAAAQRSIARHDPEAEQL